VTLDLNGQTLTMAFTGQTANVAAIDNKGTLTIKGSSANGGRKLAVSAAFTTAGKYAYGVCNTGSLTISGGDISVSGSYTGTFYYVVGIYCDGASASCTMSGGSVALKDSTGTHYGVWLKNGASFNLEGGTVSAVGVFGGASYGINQNKGNVNFDLQSGELRRRGGQVVRKHRQRDGEPRDPLRPRQRRL